MNYLLDKKTKRNRTLKIVLGGIALVVLFYFRVGVFGGFSYVAEIVFHPILSSGNIAGGKLQSIGAYFSSKNSLARENEDLRAKIEKDSADRANYDSVVAENASLKETLNRKSAQVNMTLAAILSKPNQSAYDTMLIDIGEDKGAKVGEKVFAFGDIPIGNISEVYPNSSKVVLFSSSGNKTEVVISSKNIFMELVGRGGGNFEMILPTDLVLLKGDQVVLPGVTPSVVGVLQTIVSDPRDSSQKAIFTSPVNIQELKFVEVEH